MMIRCDHEDCIAPATVAIVFTEGHFEGAEVYFCAEHFARVERRVAKVKAAFEDLDRRGVDRRMAARIVASAIDRRAL